MSLSTTLRTVVASANKGRGTKEQTLLDGTTYDQLSDHIQSVGFAELVKGTHLDGDQCLDSSHGPRIKTALEREDKRATPLIGLVYQWVEWEDGQTGLLISHKARLAEIAEENYQPDDLDEMDDQIQDEAESTTE